MSKKKVCIIQARSDSKRLPRKILLPICGKPMLWHLIERVKRSKLIDLIVVAIPLYDKSYGGINKITNECGVLMFAYRGLTADLVSRHLATAKKFHADIIVRIPGDNPCVDPVEIDRIIETQSYNYSRQPMSCLYSNIQDILDSGYPDGIGAEVYSMELLKWIDYNAKGKELREHPHKICYDRNIVKTISCPDDIRRPEIRLDVNTQADFDFITEIYEALYPNNPNFNTKDIITYIDRRNADNVLLQKNTSKPFYRETILNNLFNRIKAE